MNQSRHTGCSMASDHDALPVEQKSHVTITCHMTYQPMLTPFS